ncbi:DegT/DnrJ/EryC1/StrS family aminotransferase [Paracerasibacillus soli]|uniref:DegT/DnrJ/EryC1/StrS family aminotransferase n=1 Tax=Paracerasibacillus soli TaxID=480284 RepID=A0ABU5CSK4_9BACI|nr:DegT/DnrJ/EryC1/StrS family aminotransferase [Virgibacillus soli]MDY0409353.1 DegT/DnrJ/EryC1/StrS family aminotransferase [Virgibacillus soli]
MDLKGEIITTPFTFASSTLAIENCNLKPIFCDIDPNNYTIDVTKIEELITPNTSAILAVHVFGNPCDVYAIDAIAKKHKLKVIYDAAHAFGVEIDGKGIAEFGDVSMFSLHATKVFNSIEGGILAFRNRELVNKLGSLKNFGLSGDGEVIFQGTNAKMNEFQAAMGLCNLKTVNSDLEKRRTLYKEYENGLKDVSFIQLMETYEDVKYNGSYFPIRFSSIELRDHFFGVLKKYNVMSRKYFYPLTNEFTFDKNLSSKTPISKHISNGILALPLYTDLSVETVRKIVEIIIYEGDCYKNV